MYDLELREKEIFETIKKIKNIDFVIIGGYAVNVYTPPRFSVDADIVVLDSAAAKKAAMILEGGEIGEPAKMAVVGHAVADFFVRLRRRSADGFSNFAEYRPRPRRRCCYIRTHIICFQYFSHDVSSAKYIRACGAHPPFPKLFLEMTGLQEMVKIKKIYRSNK